VASGRVEVMLTGLRQEERRGRAGSHAAGRTATSRGRAPVAARARARPARPGPPSAGPAGSARRAISG
jgi:hypothetical protein